jgi:hypothetical protein
MIMPGGRHFMKLALFFVTLLLVTGLPSGSQEPRQSVENYGPSQQGSYSSADASLSLKETPVPKTGAELSVPNLETILARMSGAAIQNRIHRRPYTVTREYELFGRKRDIASSRVIADVTFLPPELTTYRIQRSEGSIIGEQIVRHVLAGETVIVKDHHSTDINRDNYDFAFLREEVAGGRPCHVLQLLPRRKDNNLLRGAIWVDAETYLTHRVEGEPQKSPSWWLRDIRVVFVFADVDKVWQPTSSEFSANVRVIGPWTMRVHDVGYRFSPFAGAGEDPAQMAPVSEEADADRGGGAE